MAYVTGSANSFAELLTAIRNACTANGWTLSGNVLHKGTCYVAIVMEPPPFHSSTSVPANSHLSVRAGNGIDGSNALTDQAGRRAWFGVLRSATDTTWPDWSWPVTYHVHINAAPDEVWVLVNYNVDYWQWIGFGQSPAAGNAGTGNWHAASLPEHSTATQPVLNPWRVNQCRTGAAGVVARGGGNLPGFCPLPFWMTESVDATVANYCFPGYCIHGAVSDADGTPIWSSPSLNFLSNFSAGYAPHTVSAAKTHAPLYASTPSVWNSESLLLPVQILQGRLSSKVSLIGQLGHARLCRNNYIAPGEVISLGTDQWKVYPAYRRNEAATGDVGSDTLQSGADHSGTFALAVRYDGP